jgi:hypothetical protein
LCWAGALAWAGQCTASATACAMRKSRRSTRGLGALDVCACVRVRMCVACGGRVALYAVAYDLLVSGVWPWPCVFMMAMAIWDMG